MIHCTGYLTNDIVAYKQLYFEFEVRIEIRACLTTSLTNRAAVCKYFAERMKRAVNKKAFLYCSCSSRYELEIV